jgi:DNA-binding CsgD family transcriptional regulator/tetratricopeptide (TPR) repeat protein
MTVRAGDRRGRAVRGSSGLLERDAALRWIDRILDHAGGGSGQALLIEGHAGMGKTRLHEAALDAARGRELRVLRAAGAELEGSLAFGVAAQLVRAQLSELPPARRRSLLAMLPEAVGAFAKGAELPQQRGGGGDLALAHGLFTLIATADEGRPALIAIDDLQWCDVASLEFVLYLLHRLDELPIALLMTARISAFDQISAVLDQIAAHPKVALERLRPLGPEAVAELVGEELDQPADDTVVHACLQATAGNPFYVHELLLALREEKSLSSEELAQRARALAPDAVARIVRVRVGKLGRAAASLARAMSILGDDAPLRHAAVLAELPFDAASSAADALAGEEILLAREPLRFVHPLVRHAIANDIPRSERAGRHLEAARLLHAEGAPPERVAAHLLHGRAQGDEWVVTQLCAASREAAGRAAPQSAARYLRRALEEPPPAARRAEVLADLGMMEAAAGLPSAAKHLERAFAATDDPARRAELALERGRALDAQGLHEQAARAFDQGLRELAPGPSERDLCELRDQLQAGFVASATFVPALLTRVIKPSGLLEQLPGRPATQGQRLLLAEAAMQASLAGRRAELVSELAERAWDQGRLLAEAAPQRVGWRVAATAFCLAGELERSVEISQEAVEDAQRCALPLAFATASFTRALPQLWQGQVDAALADLEAALGARRYGWRQFARTAVAHYALCLIEKGDPDRAEKVLLDDAPPHEVRDLEDALRLYSLGAVRLAQGRAKEAFELALAAGENVERTVEFFGFCPWRAAAAQAALVLGDRDQALELASDAAARAEQIGILQQRIRTLRVLGLCQTGAEQLETLHSAVRLGGDAPPRLETIRALVELGAAMRRNNQRVAAREPLGLAADMALAGGAVLLHTRARTELLATGARPRRDAVMSGLESLTPSERRIAELAASGKANREIAHGLFVTPKTVEYHLRNVYRKLDIAKRGELPSVLVR